MQPFFLPCTNLDALGYTFHVAWICNALSLIPPHPPSNFSVYITFPNTLRCTTPLIDAPSPSRCTKLLIHAPSLARHVSKHDAVCVPAREERQVLGGHRLGVEDLGMPGRREGGGGAKVWTCMYQLGKRARTGPAQECLGAGGGEEVWTRHYTGGKKCPLPPPPLYPLVRPQTPPALLSPAGQLLLCRVQVVGLNQGDTRSHCIRAVEGGGGRIERRVGMRKKGLRGKRHGREGEGGDREKRRGQEGIHRMTRRGPG